MAKLPVVSGQDMVKVASSLGFEPNRIKGSHAILKKGNSLLVIPLHKTLKKGTLLAIMKTLGLDHNGLEGLLKRK